MLMFHYIYLNVSLCLPKCFTISPYNISGTHNGTFHCDEALACFMLKQLPEYKDATIGTFIVVYIIECIVLQCRYNTMYLIVYK